VAVATFVLSGYEAQAAVLYLQTRFPGHPLSASELAREVEDVFVSWPTEDIVALWYPETPQQERLRQKAQAFLTERDTIVWLEKQNFEHGVAASSIEPTGSCPPPEAKR